MNRHFVLDQQQGGLQQQAGARRPCVVGAVPVGALWPQLPGLEGLWLTADQVQLSYTVL